MATISTAGKFAKGTVTLRMRDPDGGKGATITKDVPALLYKGLAIHDHWDGPNRPNETPHGLKTVIHAASGKAVGSLLKVTAARRFVVLLAELPIDWTQCEEEVIKQADALGFHIIRESRDKAEKKGGEA